MKDTVKSYLKKVISRINPLSLAALLAFILLYVTVAYGAVPLEGEKELYDRIIRFHVIANSDGEADQELKLKVRDAVTGYTTVLLDGCTDINDAKRLISENREEIVSVAEKVISENGYSYDAVLDEGFEIYPKREYGKYTFPAGNYYSVRIRIGDAKGKNWWCVLFPPMCLGSASVEKFNDDSQLSEIGFSEEDISIISEEKSVRKEVRFFFLDLFNYGK